MSFPKFIRLATVPLIRLVKLNDTTVVEEVITDFYEQLFAGLLAQKLRFSYEAVATPDKQWGSRLSDGNWTGMVAQLLRNEADMIVLTLSITEERREAIDFSYPYYIERAVFATRQLEPTIDQESFLKPFSLQVWVCLWACAFMLPIIYSILFMKRFSCGHFQRVHRSFLRPSDTVPKNIPEYLLRTCKLFFEALMGWSYAAVLLSFLTFPPLTGVRNVEELANAVRQGKYQCFAYPGVEYVDQLLHSEDENRRTIGKSLDESEGYRDFDAVLSNTKLPKKPAYVSSEGIFIGVSPKYFISEDGLFPDYRGIGVRKDFCCRPQLDSAVHEIWATGIYTKLIKDYARKKTYKILWESPITENEDDRRILSLSDFQGVFYILVAGYSVAIGVFLCELLHWKITGCKISPSSKEIK